LGYTIADRALYILVAQLQAMHHIWAAQLNIPVHVLTLQSLTLYQIWTAELNTVL